MSDRWASQGLGHGFDSAKVREISDKESRAEKVSEPPKDGAEIVGELTGQNATFTKVQALHQTALDAQGKLSGQQALDRAEAVLSTENGAVSLGVVTRDQAAVSNLKSGDRYTTPAVIEMEQKMLTTAQQMVDKHGFQVDAAKVAECAQAKGLSDQQTRALGHLTGANQAAVLQGWAGSGKSYLLSAARESWESAGFEVKGAALANAAAQNLQAEAGIKSSSIAKLQYDIEQGDLRLSNRTVLVLDEAGMIGTRQMAELVQKCEEAGAKIVIVGDTNQLQPIEAGAAMRAVAERIGMAELNEVRRQTSQIDRDIAADFRHGRAGEALAKLDALDRLHISADMSHARAGAVQSFLADRAEGKTSLLIAATRAEVHSLNSQVRAELQAAGQVQRDGVVAKTAVGYREFSSGDQIVFSEKFAFGLKGDQSKEVINGSTGRVVETREVDGKAILQVQLDKSGQTVRVDLSQMSKVDHGYASTVHKAQGATVDKVHAVVGEHSGREWSYVAASRNRESVQIYTSKDHYERAIPGVEKEASDLEKGMSRSQSKDLAVDYKLSLREEAEFGR